MFFLLWKSANRWDNFWVLWQWKWIQGWNDWIDTWKSTTKPSPRALNKPSDQSGQVKYLCNTIESCEKNVFSNEGKLFINFLPKKLATNKEKLKIFILIIVKEVTVQLTTRLQALLLKYLSSFRAKWDISVKSSFMQTKTCRYTWHSDSVFWEKYESSLFICI